MNPANLTVGAGALTILVLGDRLLPGRPIPLVVSCSSLLLSRLAGLSGVGVTLLGAPPPGTASLLTAARAVGPRLLPLGISVFLLSHVQDISAAREWATREREECRRAMSSLASGATNVAAGVMGGMPVAGAGLPPSLAHEEGGRAPLALAVSGVLILRSHTMSTFTTRDGAKIVYKDWGTGQPVVSSHGWPSHLGRLGRADDVPARARPSRRRPRSPRSRLSH